MQLTRSMGAALLALAVAGPAVSHAQTFPTKTVRLILPFPPGGPSDILGRALAQKLTEQMGQTVIADNRPGAGGNLGLELTSKAPPDGYTVVLSSPLIALSPSFYTKLNYGSGGVGTTTHLAPELLQSLTGVKLVHVPYKGSGVALISLVSGEVDMLVMAVPAAAQQVAAGRVRALAILSETRAATLPQVPTAKEAGFEKLVIDIWYGILAPSGTPQPIVNRLNTEINKALASPDLKDRLVTAGIQPLGNTPEQFASFIRSETTRFAKVVKDAGIKPQ